MRSPSPTLDAQVPDAASLAERARGGDLAAFEALYRRHSGRVLGTCARLVRDRREAEELAQDAWVRAWERMDQFRGDAAFSTWMHRLTVNLLLDRKRSDARWLKRIGSLDDEGDSVRTAARVAPAGAALDLERAVAGLPEGARVIFLLHDVDGYKHREIAERLGVAVGTVKAQLHRARRLMKEALDR